MRLTAKVDPSVYGDHGSRFKYVNVNGSLNGPADCLNKLGEYEDAEEQGRLVKLPCKVGDPLYLIVGDNDNEIVELIAIEFRYGLDNRLGCRAKYADEPGYVDLFDFEFGRTVFLSREDAAAAVKGVDE